MSIVSAGCFGGSCCGACMRASTFQCYYCTAMCSLSPSHSCSVCTSVLVPVVRSTPVRIRTNISVLSRPYINRKNYHNAKTMVGIVQGHLHDACQIIVDLLCGTVSALVPFTKYLVLYITTEALHGHQRTHGTKR